MGLLIADDAISPADKLDLADAAFTALGCEDNDECLREKLDIEI